jgi:fatty acid-binding protein DegV
LVKGGRLSNSAAMIGNLLNIKPILRFDEEGKMLSMRKLGQVRKPLNGSIKSWLKIPKIEIIKFT